VIYEPKDNIQHRERHEYPVTSNSNLLDCRQYGSGNAVWDRL